MCDTDNEMSGYEEQEKCTDDNKTFNKDKFCLELLESVLIYEKKVLQKYDLTDLKNMEIFTW